MFIITKEPDYYDELYYLHCHLDMSNVTDTVSRVTPLGY
jgi:hypothetical protein